MEENKRRSADREGVGRAFFLWRIVDGYDKMIIV